MEQYGKSMVNFFILQQRARVIRKIKGMRSVDCGAKDDFRIKKRLEAKSVLTVRWLGRVPYRKGLLMQEEIVSLRSAGKIKDTLLLLEHPHTYTVGTRGNEGCFPSCRIDLEAKGVHFHMVERGGDVTYHGPGQLVGYPIIDLKPMGLDLIKYVRNLEDVLILSIESFGVKADRLKGYPGVWVGSEKIAAIGIKVNKEGVAFHGFALNITTDLDFFSFIVPCGIKDKGITSLAKILGTSPSMDEVVGAVAESFKKVFQVELNLSMAANMSSGFKGLEM
ncbi:MAG: lipoyl(octanoyl) transferase LipB [Desulfobacteraceae bacterium]|nr:MAG: lipoyl(octanoyl) transferase LipB [Desulfobacteraceae bacterium]